MSSSAVRRRTSQVTHAPVSSPNRVTSSDPLSPTGGQRKAATSISALRDSNPPLSSTLPTWAARETRGGTHTTQAAATTYHSMRPTHPVLSGDGAAAAAATTTSHLRVSGPTLSAPQRHDMLQSTLVAAPGSRANGSHPHLSSTSSAAYHTAGRAPARSALHGKAGTTSTGTRNTSTHTTNTRRTAGLTHASTNAKNSKQAPSILSMITSPSQGSVSGKKERSERTTTTGGVETAVVVRSEKDSLAFSLCVQALQEGCIDSYMHLFELANRPPVCVDELSQTYFTIPDEKLRWVQEQLCAVEVLRRQSEFREVYTRCVQVANYFEEARDVSEASWCYERALQYVRDSLDRGLEQEVHAAYAAFYERHHQMPLAEKMYMRMYRLATALQDTQTIRSVAVCLVRVYRALADETVAEANSHRLPLSTTTATQSATTASAANHAADEDRATNNNNSNSHSVCTNAKHVQGGLGAGATALAYYEKSVLYAQRSGSASEESAAYEALGNYLTMTGDLTRALQCHRRFRVLAKREEQTVHACRAALAVANLETRLHLREEAAESLREALSMAKQLGDSARVCRATMQMGDICRSSGDNAAAAACFKESFAAACESGQPELIESARVAMGFARGAHLFMHTAQDKGYCYMVCHDLRAQLRWLGAGIIN